MKRSMIVGNVHMMLQGKGGVGKSFAMALLAQYTKSKGRDPLCIDSDPVNGTFFGYGGLNVVQLDVMVKDKIDPRKFDNLVTLLSESNGREVIIDNGAASFVPLSYYLRANDTPALMTEMGHKLFIHTVITGGQAFTDTITGFQYLLRHFLPPVEFIVWLNPYWGPILDDEREFKDFEGYQNNAHRIAGVIELPDFDKETHGRDLSDMLQKRLTFDEALAVPSIGIAVHHRLKIMRKQLFELLDKVLGTDSELN
jgi:hypothetical protein